MPRVLSLILLFASIGSFAPAALAESRNPADYPLRIHIYRRNETTFYHNRQAEEARGVKLQTSSGFETFPAQWKKAGQELVILQPRFGRSGFDTCRLKVMMKDFVYVAHNGNLSSEPSEVFKQWMTQHEYDPEHGKDTPVRLAPAAGNPVGPTPANSRPPAPAAPPQ
jgi:hypothetical protein